jgi:integrase
MPYFIKSKDRWMGQVKVNGQKYRKEFETKKEAKKWESNHKRELQQKPIISLHDFALTYLDYSKVRHANITYMEKQAVFKNILKTLPPAIAVDKITKGDILSYLQKQTQERSGNAANKERKNLIAAWNYGMKYMEGFPQFNPCNVDKFPSIQTRKYVPPEKDFWKVVEIAESAQDYAMLFSYLHLAARRSELFGLRWSDVDFANQKVRLYTRKRKDGSLEYDWLPMTDSLYDVLLVHRQNAENEWVFPYPKTNVPYVNRSKWMARLCELAGVKHFTLHAIRHLTASILIQADVSLIDIQAILRHKHLTTTERYTHRMKSLRPALSVISGGKGPLKGPPIKKGLKAESS